MANAIGHSSVGGQLPQGLLNPVHLDLSKCWTLAEQPMLPAPDMTEAENKVSQVASKSLNNDNV